MSYNSPGKINSSDQERTLNNLTVNTAALLCYVGIWISGIVFLVLEQKNRFIRFHALQSIFTFGILSIASTILSHFPVIGQALSVIVGIAGFILWIILMVKAGHGEFFLLPWVGELAERLAYDSMPQPPSSQPGREGPAAQSAPSAATAPSQPAAAPQTPDQPIGTVPPVSSSPQPPVQAAMPPEPPAQPAGAVPPPSFGAPPPPQAMAAAPIIVEPRDSSRSGRRHDRFDRSETFRARYYSFGARSGRIVGSAFAIAWSIALIIFFNFFHQYIAYYHANTAGGATVWEVYPVVTGAFENWLPIATIALSVTIIGHAFMIAYDRYIARQVAHMVIDLFSLASIISLVAIFPFDFSPIPNLDVINGLETGLPILFIFIAVCIGIGLLVRFITTIVHLAENRY